MQTLVLSICVKGFIVLSQDEFTLLFWAISGPVHLFYFFVFCCIQGEILGNV